MITEIEQACTDVGITAIITNSRERLETQLNRIQSVDTLPIMLISWDIETNLSFDSNGFLNNPASSIVCLLMDKSSDTKKETMEATAEAMGVLYQQFIVKLNQNIKFDQRDNENPLSNISYKLVPDHGAGKHSGILGRFNIKTKVDPNCV